MTAAPCRISPEAYRQRLARERARHGAAQVAARTVNATPPAPPDLTDAGLRHALSGYARRDVTTDELSQLRRVFLEVYGVPGRGGSD